ncbi:hypothetical protein Pan216_49320 [Planctomycetes bacterium Pan216]|uniref:Uncharacterized protein n=1 Tax=Kolteria novifilia TaxID=2527975 RepID=A0A518BAN9_9BACT|nr:hypothetical protein Pan216_49320 [Planctomycetes bacterium Pan216]
MVLYPTRGTVGNHVSARIDEEGRFAFEEAPVGPVSIRIDVERPSLPPEEQRLVDPRFLERLRGPSSPFTATTKAGRNVALQINLQPLSIRILE